MNVHSKRVAKRLIEDVFSNFPVLDCPLGRATLESISELSLKVGAAEENNRIRRNINNLRVYGKMTASRPKPHGDLLIEKRLVTMVLDQIVEPTSLLPDIK